MQTIPRLRSFSAAIDHARVWWPLALLLIFAIPTLAEFFRGEWSTDNQNHGPVIIAVSAYLFFHKFRGEVPAPVVKSDILAAAAISIVGGILLAVGKMVDLPALSGVAVVATVASGVILAGGIGTLRKTWFPVGFLLFMVPLPVTVVSYLTTPLKLLVSTGAVALLGVMGEPVSRQGVTMNVGQYQLLVADACSGLNSIFALEALGLVYLSLIGSASKVRTVVLAFAILPISISSNIMRVVALSLITLYLGDEAGQGFLHGFAGMTLFLIGLMLMLAIDTVLCKIIALPCLKR